MMSDETTCASQEYFHLYPNFTFVRLTSSNECYMQVKYESISMAMFLEQNDHFFPCRFHGSRELLKSPYYESLINYKTLMKQFTHSLGKSKLILLVRVKIISKS
jgi:hypothetical protein